MVPCMRVFTDREQSVLIAALLAARPHVAPEDRQVIDGIVRDGWKPVKG